MFGSTILDVAIGLVFVYLLLSLLLEEANQDGQGLKQNIESWFNSSMNRGAGWYKRKTQAVNMMQAGTLMMAVNIDS